MSRGRVSLIVILSIVVVAIGVRLALPSLVKHRVNKSLHTMRSYQGSVADIDIHLWRGAYRIIGLQIVKIGSDQPVPFFNTDALDLSVEWRSLLHGSIVAEAEFYQPRLNLVQSDNKQQSQLGEDQNWVDKLRELAPIRFNTVSVNDGQVTFRVPGIRVQDALEASQVNGHISNLTNVVALDKETFSDFDITGRVLNDAPLQIAGSINPFAQQTTFDVNLKLENVQLPEVNPWLHEFIKADAESGRFDLYIEMAAASGRFKGYAKPVMQDVKIGSSGKDNNDPLRKIWEGIVEVAIKIFENRQEDQVAARIPFSGSIDNPKAGLFETLISVLRNAFVGAFSRSLEDSISLRDVKKNLQDANETAAAGKQPGAQTAPQKKPAYKSP